VEAVVNFRFVALLIAESVSSTVMEVSHGGADSEPPITDSGAKDAGGGGTGGGVDNKNNNNKPAKVGTKSCSEYYQGPLTRVALTKMAVRKATTRWDKEDGDAVTATPTTDDDDDGLLLRIWCVSSLLTVLCYLICFGTIPLIVFLSAWYTRKRDELRDEQAANDNSTSNADAVSGGGGSGGLGGLLP